MSEFEVTFDISQPQLEAEFTLYAYGEFLFRNGLKEEDGIVDVIPATGTTIGGVIIGENILVNADGVISIPYSTNSSNGVIRIATDGEIDLGTLENVAINPKQLMNIKLHVKEYVDQAIATEKARAEAAEAQLQVNINTEKARAEAAEQELSNSIVAEINRAEAAESTLGTRIENESARALIAEQGLSNSINAEVTRATTAETNLNTKIDNEVTRATTAEANLNTKIETETSRATTAETNLNTKIDNEVTRATTREQELQVYADTKITYVDLGEEEVISYPMQEKLHNLLDNK